MKVLPENFRRPEERLPIVSLNCSAFSFDTSSVMLPRVVTLSFISSAKPDVNVANLATPAPTPKTARPAPIVFKVPAASSALRKDKSPILTSVATLVTIFCAQPSLLKESASA